MGSSKSSSPKPNPLGLFIGVYIDFGEFHIAILNEEWKGVKEKKAITSVHAIEVKDDVQERLVNTIVEQIEKDLENNKDFRKRPVKKIVVTYNGPFERFQNFNDKFQEAVKGSKVIKLIIEKDEKVKKDKKPEIECMGISNAYCSLIFGYGYRDQRFTDYHKDHHDSMNASANIFNGVLFASSTIWSLLQQIQPTAEGGHIANGWNRFSHGKTDEEGSGYAIARNILNKAITSDFSEKDGGTYLRGKIGEHFGLTDPRDIVHLMNQSGARQKLASLARTFVIRDPTPENIFWTEFNNAGYTHMFNYMGPYRDAKESNLFNKPTKMALFLIGFRPEQLEYFQFNGMFLGKQVSIKWYCLDEELEKPEVATVYLASSLSMGEPLIPFNVRHVANGYAPALEQFVVNLV